MTDLSHEMKEQSELEKLKEENARLRSALEFYADEKSWNDDNIVCTYDVIDESDRSIPEGCCDYRGGKRAREALGKGSSDG